LHDLDCGIEQRVPPWFAVTLHVPEETNVTTPAEMVHTDGVLTPRTTVSAGAVVVALGTYVAPPTVALGGIALVNDNTWEPFPTVNVWVSCTAAMKSALPD